MNEVKAGIDPTDGVPECPPEAAPDYPHPGPRRVCHHKAARSHDRSGGVHRATGCTGHKPNEGTGPATVGLRTQIDEEAIGNGGPSARP
jgi:hypothetical protein